MLTCPSTCGVSLAQSATRRVLFAGDNDAISLFPECLSALHARTFKIKSLCSSVQFSSVAQSCLTLCDPMSSIPGLPVHHQLPESTQTHVHWVSDAIQPSHPLLSPSPALNLSQYQSLFKCLSSSHQVAKVLELQLQHQSFQWIIQDWFPLGLTSLISLLSKGLSRVFSNTTVQKHQLFGTQPSLRSNSHIHTWTLEKP